MTTPLIPADHLKAVCKMGHGTYCCRYIVADGRGIQCAKHDDLLAFQINQRVASGAFTAISDNCDGLKDEPDFHYFECPECGFDSVQPADFGGGETCPLCAGDTGHDVLMHRRRALNTDKPEGKDARNDGAANGKA